MKREHPCLFAVLLTKKDGLPICLIMNTLLFLMLSILTSGVSASESDAFSISEVAPGIYLHSGVHARFEDRQHDDIANIGFIIGDKCTAVIDTGGSVAIGNSLRSAIREVTDKPICYVINTHIHFDHVLGNLSFSDSGPVFVGNENLKQEIEENRTFFLSQFSNDLGPNPSTESIIGPGKGVTDKTILDLGDRKLVLTAYPTAHSYSDLTVLDEKTGTLWSGDLLFRERIPSLSGSLKGWLSVMESLASLEITLVIPGHGTTAKSLPEAMHDQKRYLDSLLNETRQALSEGLFLDEAVERIGNEEKLHWLLHEQHHKANVIKAFTELEWE